MYYLTLQVFPLSYWSYVIQLFLLVFIPISGRRGADNNPDVLVGCLVSFLFCVLIQFLTPVLVKIEKRINNRIITFLVSVLVILQSFTTLIFIYILFHSYRFTSVNPTQKTCLIFKVMSYIITLICVLSNDSIGFPYNEDPTSPKQKRLVILKTEREFIELYARKDSIENTISAKDSGFYIIR